MLMQNSLCAGVSKGWICQVEGGIKEPGKGKVDKVGKDQDPGEGH